MARKLLILASREPIPDRLLENAIKVKSALNDVLCGIHRPMVMRTVADLAEPGKQLCLGRAYKDYLNVDLFTARPEVDFPKAFSRSIAVDVVDGLRARIVSEDDLEIIGPKPLSTGESVNGVERGF